MAAGAQHKLSSGAPRILITGKTEQPGWELVRAFISMGEVFALDRE